MKVTRIAPAAKQQGVYAVYVDGSFAFSLGETTLLESGLAPGQELTDEALRVWRQTAQDDVQYARALRYAALRPRSEWELQQYLSRKGASPPLADQVLNKLRNIGLIDDNVFARSWVANRRLLRPSSRLKLQHELRLKHVAEDAIERAIGHDTEAEIGQLMQLARAKRKQTKYASDERKLLQYLSRQGFGYGAIKEAVRRLSDDE